MPGRIFVSYRRDDAAADAGRLTDHLQRRFGRKRIFLDIDSIDPGTDFVQVLEASLQKTAAMLVVIGPRWTSLRKEDHSRRLDDPDDFVVREVAAALRRDIPVVPVLVQGAPLPAATDLPASIAGLVTRQTAVIDHAEFHDDVERLCARLATMVGDGYVARWRRWWPAAALVAALGVGLIAYQRSLDDDQPVSTIDAPPPAAATAPITTSPAAGVTPGPDFTSAAPGAASSSPPAAPARKPSVSPAGRRASAPAEERASSPGVSPPPAATFTPEDLRREAEKVVLEMQAAERARRVDSLLAEAAAQRGRGQTVGALATLASARELAPGSDAVRQAQETLAIDWIRNVRFEGQIAKPALVEPVKAILGVFDASLASATGVRRADLLAYAGWATYMLWRGDQRTDPTARYREALSIDPENPLANAMLAHWTFRHGSDTAGARRLFETARRTTREAQFVRSIQWAAFGTEFQRHDDVELVRLSDDMRRNGEKLSPGQASALHLMYSVLAATVPIDRDVEALLAAVPPDDHIRTVQWALEEYMAGGTGESRRLPIRYTIALLHEKAGRVPQAIAELQALEKTSLARSAQAALARLVPVPPRNRRE